MVVVSKCVVFAEDANDDSLFSPQLPRRQHTTLGKEIAFAKDNLSQEPRM